MVRLGRLLGFQRVRKGHMWLSVGRMAMRKYIHKARGRKLGENAAGCGQISFLLEPETLMGLLQASTYPHYCFIAHCHFPFSIFLLATYGLPRPNVTSCPLSAHLVHHHHHSAQLPSLTPYYTSRSPNTRKTPPP